MELKIGESKTVKLPFWLKGVDIRCENNGLTLLRQGQIAVLNVTDRKFRETFAAVRLGYVSDLNQYGMTVKAQSRTRMIVSVGAVKIVVDYAAKKAAANVLGMVFYGSAQWGEQVQIPWQADFMPLFGLPQPSEELDRNTAEVFWKWFHGSEADIVRLLNGTGKESKMVFRQVNLWLVPVFPYIKSKWIDFDLRCKGEEKTFFIYHKGNERLKADAEEFAAMMPEGLAIGWKVVVTE